VRCTLTKYNLTHTQAGAIVGHIRGGSLYSLYHEFVRFATLIQYYHITGQCYAVSHNIVDVGTKCKRRRYNNNNIKRVCSE